MLLANPELLEVRQEHALEPAPGAPVAAGSCFGGKPRNVTFIWQTKGNHGCYHLLVFSRFCLKHPETKSGRITHNVAAPAGPGPRCHHLPRVAMHTFCKTWSQTYPIIAKIKSTLTCFKITPDYRNFLRWSCFWNEAREWWPSRDLQSRDAFKNDAMMRSLPPSLGDHGRTGHGDSHPKGTLVLVWYSHGGFAWQIAPGHSNKFVPRYIPDSRLCTCIEQYCVKSNLRFMPESIWAKVSDKHGVDRDFHCTHFHILHLQVLHHLPSAHLTSSYFTSAHLASAHLLFEHFTLPHHISAHLHGLHLHILHLHIVHLHIRAAYTFTFYTCAYYICSLSLSLSLSLFLSLSLCLSPAAFLETKLFHEMRIVHHKLR